jgi:hypothetical protein
MKNKDFNNYVKKIGNNVDNIYNAFYLWKNLQNAKYNTIYNRYKYFWGITISSVQLNWLLGIPKLFEEPKKEKNEVVSIPFLLKFIPEGEDKEKIKKEIDNQKPILKNFKKWRNKILAHQDKIVADNIKDFYKKYPIKGEQIEKLLSSIAKILGMIESITTNHSIIYSFSSFKEGSKRDLDGIISKLSKDLGVFKRT